MENWHRLIFLKTLARIPASARLLLGVFVISIASLPAYAADDEVDDELGDFEEVGLIPEVERREIKISDIDTENFEIGIAAGLMSVEDFETNPLVVGSFTYHVTEDFFVEARMGQTEVGQTSFDKLSGGASLLPSDDRKLQFYDLSLGMNVFPGEAFILNRWAVNSGFYLVGGVGSTNFAGNDEFTINGGVGYRVLVNDFLSLNFHVRDHIFETEITGDKKTTHNFELSAGLSIFF
jgi:outer membrane beta-barrel protein